MFELEFETVVAAPIGRVWEWHQNVREALVKLSPPEDDVKLERVDEPIVVGSEVVISAKGPGSNVGIMWFVPGSKRIVWVARYVEIVEPKAVLYVGEGGGEGRFVDEQVSGPFAYWRHSHEFESEDGKTTRCLDRITYKVPYGPLGWVGNWLVVRPKLKQMFAHRHRVLRVVFGVP